MKYVSLTDCKEEVFPYIYEQLSSAEPSAKYEEEPEGLKELEKVLALVKQNSFYPTLIEKAAYILCSIAGSQYFSNGNKRLGVVTLLQFLIVNSVVVLVLSNEDAYIELLRKAFPQHTWEHNSEIKDGNPLFLYNLAIVIGDRKKWSKNDNFTAVKEKITKMFQTLYIYEET
ncbi:MAG: Fic family protein [Candidatus Andersenbacteria bacterium]|nr:Fic family protein [Candidatus Andersenbacteria bacterium]